MNQIDYKITFLSDWHIGSGLSGGAEIDAVVLKDKNGLPYIPGKTMKGLCRDALEDIKDAKGLDQKIIEDIFGIAILDDKIVENTNSKAVFSNVSISETEQKEIQTNELSDFMYRNIASTAIQKNGIAENESLRVMEVTIPISLLGSISNISDDAIAHIENALKLIRRVGIDRNNGLGRCTITINQKKND